MKKAGEKLIRDRVPEIIQQEGKTTSIGTYDYAEFKKALLLKLIEEAAEVAETTSAAELTEELADLFEVIECIIETFSLSRDSIRSVQRKKRHLRGGFEKRQYLITKKN